ncbi:fungal-specific transcription factor domain-containing protein [Trichoderma gracile]
MGDSLDQGRPAKRIKLAPHPQPSHPHSVSYSHPHQQQRLIRPAPSNTPVVPAAAAAAVAHTWVHVVPGPRGGRRVRRRVRSRGGRAGPGPETARPEADLEPGSSPASTASTSSLTSSSTLPWPHPEPMPTMTAAVETTMETALMSLDATAPLVTEFDLTPLDQGSLSHSVSPEQQPGSPEVDLVAVTNPDPVLPADAEHMHSRHKTRAQSHPRSHGFVSPFKDCIATFGKQPSPRFPRPTDGRVNSYIKFNWPTRRPQGGRSSSVSASTRPGDDAGGEDEVEEIVRPSSQSSSALATPGRHLNDCASQASHEIAPRSSNPLKRSERSWSFSDTTSPPASSGYAITSPYARPWSHGWGSSHSSMNSPQMLPTHFGLVSRMDKMDRKLWSFYIGNWCPGRSVLGKTNLWLQDFAAMEGSEGVLCAIQSLAGIYVYDYQPMEEISRRINHRFALAEARLSHLLSRTGLSVDEASELITIASILSMQDVSGLINGILGTTRLYSLLMAWATTDSPLSQIVLTERRRKRPYTPRWLEGFKQSEHFLETIDEGSRFWSKSNVQLSSLRISQSIIVGRAVVLSQLMTTLPHPATFDPEREAARFGWLLYGDMQDMYEIHGGCGFSKKLLHAFSQITYCSARLYQDPESSVIPLTAKFLLSELLDMRQWSSAPNSNPWEVAKVQPQTIEMVRAAHEGYVIDSASSMTEVTAEAWRIAAIVYLQCRALRIPRNHPDVLSNLNDLAKCINIMPTSGYNFTAQAPLFPVFLLGMLATVPGHVAVAQNWFERVTSTPVRSSVPPLYDALKRIWMWIDTEPTLKPPVNGRLDEEVGKRLPWWEHLVQRVQENEMEILCLT